MRTFLTACVVMGLLQSGGVTGATMADPGPARSGPLHSTAFEEIVGWYELDDGADLMVTWGASEGLTLNDFSALETRRLLASPSGFLRMLVDDGAAYSVHVRRTADGAVDALGWTERDGRERRARRRPSFGYGQQEVHYGTGGVELTGVLLKPTGTGPHPAVVVAHGAGDVDRDDFWYLYHADYLARRGIAVLLPDKRGCGASRGSWRDASFEDLASDALAGINVLRSTPGVDAERIGVLGLREGGWVAPLAAALADSVHFVISVAGSAVPPEDQVRHEISADIRSYGTPDFLVPLIAFALERRHKQKLNEWWDRNGEFDAIDYWRVVTQPVLVVFGGNDEREQVPVHRSVTRLEEARDHSGNGDFTVRIFQEAGPLMDDPETGWIAGEYLNFLVSWIQSRAA